MDSTLAGLGHRAFDALEALSSKLGIGVEYLWPVLVERQVIMGWSGVWVCGIFGAILFIIGIIAVIFSKDDEDLLGMSILSFALSLGCGLIIAFGSVPRIYAPEFYAVKSLMETIGVGG